MKFYFLRKKSMIFNEKTSYICWWKLIGTDTILKITPEIMKKINSIFLFLAGILFGYLFWCAIPICKYLFNGIVIDSSYYEGNFSLLLAILICMLLTYPIYLLYHNFKKSKRYTKTIQILFRVLGGALLGFLFWCSFPINLHFIKNQPLDLSYFDIKISLLF